MDFWSIIPKYLEYWRKYFYRLYLNIVVAIKTSMISIVQINMENEMIKMFSLTVDKNIYLHFLQININMSFF